MPIKSTNLVTLVTNSLTNLSESYMPSQGVQYARLGLDNPFAFIVSLLYKLPIPFANIVKLIGEEDPDRNDYAVMAFPFNTTSQGNPGFKTSNTQPQYIRPFPK